jgi:hypothetical protein
MPEDLTKSEYMMQLPIPVVIVEKNTERILFANSAAENAGLKAGGRFNEMTVGIYDAPDAKQKSVAIKAGDALLHAKMRESQVSYHGKDARLIALFSLSNEAGTLSEWDVCAVFIAAGRKGVKNEFLQLTAKGTGAFCAALYESRAQRYVLREEWRNRRSVSIPVLPPDFLTQAGPQSEKLKQTKRAADIAVFPYTKTHGTKGVAVYFFDSAVSDGVCGQLRRFVEIFGLFAYDAPDAPRHVLHHGVNALEQGDCGMERADAQHTLLQYRVPRYVRTEERAKDQRRARQRHPWPRFKGSDFGWAGPVFRRDAHRLRQPKPGDRIHHHHRQYGVCEGAAQAGRHGAHRCADRAF